MERFRLARKWWPLALGCAACLSLELLLYALVTRGALEAARAGRPIEGEWSWVSIAGWHVSIALAGAAISWRPLKELRTVITAEGVSRPRLFGRPLFVGWADAESVFLAPSVERPHLVRINAPGRSVEINLLFYKEPDALLSLVEERMRAHTRGHSCARPAAD